MINDKIQYDMIIGLSQIYKSDHMDNLRKLVLGVSLDALFDLIKEKHNSILLDNLRRTTHEYPEINFDDAFSRGQVASKQWLIDELSNIETTLKQVYILGGWYGTLSAMMFESSLFHDLVIKSYDIDPSCVGPANSINQIPWTNQGQFEALIADIYELDTNIADTIINTSCEHLSDFDKWWNTIPENKLIILQSNDFTKIDDHINCVSNIDEFKLMAPMNGILFEGTLESDQYIKYNRFMLIGRK